MKNSNFKLNYSFTHAIKLTDKLNERFQVLRYPSANWSLLSFSYAKQIKRKRTWLFLASSALRAYFQRSGILLKILIFSSFKQLLNNYFT